VEWVKLRDLARKRHWYEKYGAPACQRVVVALAGQKIVEFKKVALPNGGTESWWVRPAEEE